MRRPTARFAKYALLFSTILAVPFVASPILEAAEKSETFELLNLFGDVFERVRTDYVEETKDNELIESAINGMLTSLDPHSGYMNEKAFKEMQVQTKGEFGGLGIEVTMENGLVKVVSPIDETPAAKAGVMPGDYINQINDEPVMGMTLSDAVERMRGPVNSTVKISILREGASEPIELMLTRAVIKIKSIRARAEGDIIYVRVTSFTEQSTEGMRSEIERLKKEIGNPRGVVLDLRNNPGGLLDQAVSMADSFLDQGEIVSTRERDPAKTRRYSARAGDEIVPESLPMVVLINTGSASASEIVSGALQDHKRAIILGTKSFGKGSVQTVIPLTEHGAIRLTTARYYTPSGHSIQAKGITPDIVVEQAKIEPIKPEKMRTEADLKGRLANPEDTKEEAKTPMPDPNAAREAKEEERDIKDGKAPPKDAKDTKDGKEPKDGKDKDTRKTKGEVDSAQDFQLQRALDLLHGLSLYHQAASGK